MYHSITFKDGVKYTESKTASAGDTSCEFSYHKGKPTAMAFIGGIYVTLNVQPNEQKTALVVTFPTLVADTEIQLTITSEINTWEDWHLVPSSRPLFNPPEQKVVNIDLPGTSGLIDLSTTLTNFPLFQNRTGSIEFIVMNDYGEWYERYSEIMDYLHGKTIKAVLDDDVEFYYEGRFFVEDWTSNNDGTWSTIKIGYSVYPYKLRHQSSTSDWLWGPFNFINGVIQSGTFKGVFIDDDDWFEMNFTGLIEGRPVVPKFTVALDTAAANPYLDMQLYCYDTKINWLEKNITASGTYQFYDYVMGDLTAASVIKMKMKGHATVSIDFTSGGL